MSDDLSGDMLAPSWPNLVYSCGFIPVGLFSFLIFLQKLSIVVAQICVQKQISFHYTGSFLVQLLHTLSLIVSL